MNKYLFNKLDDKWFIKPNTLLAQETKILPREAIIFYIVSSGYINENAIDI